jgi:tetratricopeptide (TPR) repeat protein
VASAAQIGEHAHVFRWLALAFALAILAPAPARADEAQSPEQRALDLFDKSETAYQNGRFAEAAMYLRGAYALKPDPVLLYNLARAYEGMGDLDRAVKAYQDFLAAEPSAKDRASIEMRVATLNKQIADREAARKRAALPPPRKPNAVPWIVAGAGALGLGTGAVLGVLSAKAHRDARDESGQTAAESDQADAKRLATAANVALIAGGAVIAIGVVWGLLDLRASGRSTAFAPWAMPGAAGIALNAPIP